MIDVTVKPPLSILICEDEPLIRGEVAEVLKDVGYTVKVSATATEARVALAQQKYDVLLVDVELPDGSGVELSKFARAADPDIGVILASGHADVQGAAEVCNSILLTKPYGEAQLIRAIGRVTG